jgi:hypothetical protein
MYMVLIIEKNPSLALNICASSLVFGLTAWLSNAFIQSFHCANYNFSIIFLMSCHLLKALLLLSSTVVAMANLHHCLTYIHEPTRSLWGRNLLLLCSLGNGNEGWKPDFLSFDSYVWNQTLG